MKIINIIIIVLCYGIIFADNNILQREQELWDMQSQIEIQRQNAIEAEQRRLSALQNRQQAQSQLNTVQRRFQELNTTQQNIRRSLDVSLNLINQTENRLAQLQDSVINIMFHLLLSEMSETKLKKMDIGDPYRRSPIATVPTASRRRDGDWKSPVRGGDWKSPIRDGDWKSPGRGDSYLLGLYVKNLLEENNKLMAEMYSINREKELREQEFTETQNRSRIEQNRLNTITTDIRQIDSQIISFEQQKEAYQKRATELEEAANELQTLLNMLKNQERRYVENFEFPSGIETPLHGRVVTQFGTRYNSRYNVSTISNGIDIAAAENSLVRAFSDGEVVFSDVFSGSGRLIIIDHKNGYHTVYGFNNELLVRRGETVSRGQIIARSGRTGSAEEPALHFEIRKSGQPVNPLEYIVP